MKEEKRERLVGHPSDYGGRTLADEEREMAEHGQIDRTADGDPLMDRGIADSAVTREKPGEDILDQE
jgi:hypothetical protein